MRGIRNYTRESIPEDSQKIDIYDAEYVGRIFLYMFFGMLDAMWQTTAYWRASASSMTCAEFRASQRPSGMSPMDREVREGWKMEAVHGNMKPFSFSLRRLGADVSQRISEGGEKEVVRV